MALKVSDRVYETSITTGTGTYTLAGAVTGFQAFNDIGADNYCPYFATDGTNWEVGIGQYLAAPDRLARTTILDSSNAGAAVDWAAGTRKLRIGFPAPLMMRGITSRSANTIFAAADFRRTYRITGSYTQTFPAAATLGDGWEIEARVESGATWTLDPDAAETIDGAATLAIAGPWAGKVKCNGAALYTVGGASDGEYRSMQVFTGSGTWTKPAGLKRAKITVVGGGGGAGGGSSTGDQTCGGGAGGTGIKTVAASALGATETVTIGAGGAGGTTAGTAGAGGGTTSFGTVVTSTGGAGSVGSAAAGTVGPGGDGGIGASGNVNIGGGAGSNPNGWGGAGGSSMHGGGGAGKRDATGGAGRAYGGGGGGVSINAASSAGGAGFAGIVIVEEFF